MHVPTHHFLIFGSGIDVTPSTPQSILKKVEMTPCVSVWHSAFSGASASFCCSKFPLSKKKYSLLYYNYCCYYFTSSYLQVLYFSPLVAWIFLLESLYRFQESRDSGNTNFRIFFKCCFWACNFGENVVHTYTYKCVSGWCFTYAHKIPQTTPSRVTADNLLVFDAVSRCSVFFAEKIST